MERYSDFTKQVLGSGYETCQDGLPEHLQVRYEKVNGDFHLVGRVTADGYEVGDEVPNFDSISATYHDGEYCILRGIREIPVDGWGYGARDVFYADSDVEWSLDLAEEIKKNQRIDPLILAYEEDDAYILEGSHRLAAILELGLKSFPALVVFVF